MKTPSRILIGLVLAALVLSACAVTSRNALIGKWNNATQGVVLEFTMDGRMRQSGQGVTQELNYQFLDDNTIALKAPGGGQDQPIGFRVAGDTLTLDVSSGQSGATAQSQKIEFTRVK